MSDKPIMGVVHPAAGQGLPLKVAVGDFKPFTPPTELSFFLSMLRRAEVAFAEVKLAAGNAFVLVSPASSRAERSASRLQGDPLAMTRYEFDAEGALTLIHMEVR